MSRYRVKVQGPSTRESVFGCDILKVEQPRDVTDRDGVLIVTTLPYPGRPAVENDPERPGVFIPARKATGPSQVVYPRGGWTKVTITQILEEAP